jgi:hypothetical protein
MYTQPLALKKHSSCEHSYFYVTQFLGTSPHALAAR